MMRVRTMWENKIKDPSKTYLTFFTQSNNTFSFSGTGISYSLDGGKTWTSLSSGGTVTVTDGNLKGIMWKGTMTPQTSVGIGKFSSTGTFWAFGNPMSLLFGDNFKNLTSLSGYNWAFYLLFCDCVNLQSADIPTLILPATTLSERCYLRMFLGCTGITNPPELPATTLQPYCYSQMFLGCSSLETSPELPSTTLANYCYHGMFSGTNTLPDCTNIDFTSTNVLQSGGLIGLFYGTKVTDNDLFRILPINPTTGKYLLPATTLAAYCYMFMFINCNRLTTAPELPATTLTYQCYYQMFYGCQSLRTTPLLPATTLASYCYMQMFTNCYALNYVKCLATNISATSCTQAWLSGVSNTGTFAKNPNMSSWTTGDSGIPTGWTVIDYVDPKEQYLTIVSLANNNVIKFRKNSSASSKDIYVSTNGTSWSRKTSTTDGVTLATLSEGDKLYIKGNNTYYSTGSSYSNYFTTSGNFNLEGNIMSLIGGDNFSSLTSISSTQCFNHLFSSCSHLISAENLVLPATTLATACYYGMFEGCTSLTTAPSILPATTLSVSCYGFMFNNCDSLTTAPILPATTLADRCYSYMFVHCTSLTTAPELPATTLVLYCYEYMFGNCTNLNYIKAMFLTLPGTNYTNYWILNTAAAGTFVKNANALWNVSGDHGIPSGWTVILEYP